MPTIRFNLVANSLAIMTCFACAEGATEGSVDPAKTPDADVADGNADSPDLAAIWRDQPMFQSGQRLRARVLDGGGGAAAFIGFRDLELARDCEFAIAADGERRCLPVARDGSIYYLDSACTQPVYRQSTGTECKDSVAPYVIHVSASAACARDQRTRVYSVGGQRAGAVAYAAVSGGCEPVGLVDCLHTVAEEAPGQFARATIATEAVGTGFAIEWAESEDGARAISALRDTVHDVLCSLQSEIRSDTCLPLSAAQVRGGAAEASGSLFGDVACSESRAVLDIGRDACTPASIAVVREQNECGASQATAYELGSAIDVAYAKNGSGCLRFSPPAGQKVYALADPLQLDTRPALQLARGGTERLAVRYYATASGTPVQYDALQFYDSKLSRVCERRVMADGTRRCVPVGGSAAIEPAGPFRDADCTEPLVAVPQANVAGVCSPAPEYAQRTDASNLLVAVYDLESKLREPPATVYFVSDAECTGRNPKPSVGYHPLGGRLDLAVLREELY
jgi:hypothetical protein